MYLQESLDGAVYIPADDGEFNLEEYGPLSDYLVLHVECEQGTFRATMQL